MTRVKVQANPSPEPELTRPLLLTLTLIRALARALARTLARTLALALPRVQVEKERKRVHYTTLKAEATPYGKTLPMSEGLVKAALPSNTNPKP